MEWQGKELSIESIWGACEIDSARKGSYCTSLAALVWSPGPTEEVEEGPDPVELMYVTADSRLDSPKFSQWSAEGELVVFRVYKWLSF